MLTDEQIKDKLEKGTTSRILTSMHGVQGKKIKEIREKFSIPAKKVSSWYGNKKQWNTLSDN